jgi:hypothetical protein
VDDRDFPAARVLLAMMVSEIRVRTYNLPLATYPIALTDAARLIEQNRPQEGRSLLEVALNTLVIVDRAIPLPIVTAQAAIDEAQRLRDQDKNRAQQLLALAKSELERAKALGYAGNDPEYVAMREAVEEVEKQVKGGGDSSSAFARLKEKVSSFFRRQSETEKTAQVASGTK